MDGDFRRPLTVRRQLVLQESAEVFELMTDYAAQPAHHSAVPSRDAVLAEQERVVGSPAFAHADRLARFLQFIISETLAGRANQIKESVIGVEVFNRPATYDPKTDPIVRMQARQLRQKLREHYDLFGSQHGIVIELPKGGYVPRFHQYAATQEEAGEKPGPASFDLAQDGPELVEGPVPRPRARTAAVALTLAAFALASLAVYALWRSPSTSALTPPRSIAVLPLRNLTGDPEQDYLSDGLSERFITELARAGGLRVASRGSAFRFKGPDADPKDVGRRLGVEAVLEGSVRKSGANIRIDVRLVSAGSGAVLWAMDAFERPAHDIFVIEDQLACRVTAALTAKPCAPDAAIARVSRGTQDLEAYRAYLRGRSSIHAQYGPSGPEKILREAVEHFGTAIERDPQFAAAHAGLADAYTQLVWFSPADPRELLKRAKAAALRAIELDDRLVEAHTSVSAIHLHEWNFDAARKAIERAVALAPNSPWAHHEYSTYLMAMGQMDAAVREMRLAEELDPLNTTIIADSGNVLLSARRYDEGLAQFYKACDLEPDCAPTISIGGTKLLMGRTTEAVNDLRTLNEKQGAASDTLTWLAMAYARAGMRDEARRLLADLSDRARREYVPKTFIVFVHAALGQTDEAFAVLEAAYRERDFNLSQLKASPWIEPLRADPRYTDLLRRIGLPE